MQNTDTPHALKKKKIEIAIIQFNMNQMLKLLHFSVNKHHEDKNIYMRVLMKQVLLSSDPYLLDSR